MLNLIFWQNSLSIHQFSFLNALSQEHNVSLVVEREIDEVRNESGWEIPVFNCQKIIVNPALEDIERILRGSENSIHVLSGLENTFQKYNLTKRLLNGNYKVVCYLEPFNWMGWKGKLRYLKYRMFNFKYGNKLGAMLPTGEMGVKQYLGIGFNNVFEWGYFTKSNDIPNASEIKQNKKVRFLFVGSLDTRKNILPLIDIFTWDALTGYELTIVGKGPFEEEVKTKAKYFHNIKYLGVKSNEDVHRVMLDHDVLVLPSLFDGWGAVVNEALFAGMRVVASNHCGSSCLLKKSWSGSVFDLGKKGDLVWKLLEQAEMGPQEYDNRVKINKWCYTHISGRVAAKYFTSVCKYIFGGLCVKPNAPWEE